MIDTIIHGDCLEVMPRIPAKSIDLVLCDLPYGVLNRRNKEAAWDCPLPLPQLWAEYERVAKDNAAIVLFAQGMFSASLMMSNPKLWRYNLIWKKGDGVSGFLNANRMPMRNHEDILVFYKKLPVYHPQMIRDGKQHHRGGNNGRSGTYGNFRRNADLVTDSVFPRSVLDFPKRYNSKSLHPTEKPVALCEWLIRTYTDEGATVLDNTCGSGTTCVAARNTNRHYIGIEKEERYYETARRRVQEAGQSLF